MSDKISVIVPCYNEQEALPFFFEAIGKIAGKMKQEYNVDYEFVFVDDGSRDRGNIFCQYRNYKLASTRTATAIVSSSVNPCAQVRIVCT